MAIFLKTNNLINIRFNSSNKWKGQVGEYNGFVVFDCIESCLRCGCKLLLNYMRLHQLFSVNDIINRFAPSSENNTDAYVKHVCSYMRVSPNTILSYYDIPSLLKAIIKVETSFDIPLSYITDNFRLNEV